MPGEIDKMGWWLEDKNFRTQNVLNRGYRKQGIQTSDNFAVSNEDEKLKSVLKSAIFEQRAFALVYKQTNFQPRRYKPSSRILTLKD